MNRILQFGGSLRAAAVAVLCTLFLLLALGLALLSSSVYRSAVARSNETYEQRTALAYLVNQVRRGDADSALRAGSFGDSDALSITEEGLAGTYITLLYCYDGQLMELYAEEGLNFSPEDGIAILPLDGLDVSFSDGLLTLTATTEYAQTCSVTLAPRCGAKEVGSL